MAQFKLNGKAKKVAANKVAAILQAASEREQQRFNNICLIADGAKVTFKELLEQPYFDNEGKEQSFCYFVLVDENNVEFRATAKMFRPRYKVCPFVETGELSTEGIVPADGTSEKIYETLTTKVDDKLPTFVLRNLKDFYSDGVAKPTSFVGIEP